MSNDVCFASLRARKCFRINGRVLAKIAPGLIALDTTFCRCISCRQRTNREIKIPVYGKRQTSDSRYPSAVICVTFFCLSSRFQRWYCVLISPLINGKFRFQFFFLESLTLGLSKSLLGISPALENSRETNSAGYPWSIRWPLYSSNLLVR